ncbi:hypothetical protein INT48_009757 [Thamnidium elegans]|uniref:Phospholipase B1, membrane-associated n=1 Tax=Thamnidium elegans TaxID=101142 RepID=A0A8H7SQW0_9FUNG|nr:hypothetical protein INT48_009757 [Thamnidium elegans]
MRFNLAALALATTLFFSGTQAGTAPTIEKCPALTPRSKPATSISDLRPDDIKIVAALGDSIMAGFAAEGIQDNTIINIKNLMENRGISYGAGGDAGAVTVPNFIKKYSPKLKGSSVSDHLAEICFGPLCPPLQYRPFKDVLNAAQSGGLAMNLNSELDYLLPTMRLMPGINYNNDWKLINIQIGSNDQCASCIDNFIPLLTPELYGKHVTAAIERIRKNVPRVLINLIGTFNVTQVYTVTANQDYCKPFQSSDFIINSVECPCALDKKYRPKMDLVSVGYTQQLRNIYEKYKPMQTDSFGVMFSPANIDISSFPVNGLSNIDCFHPSTLGHEYVAKSLWNTMFVPLANKPTVMRWSDNLEVYCPTEVDRFQLI